MFKTKLLTLLCALWLNTSLLAEVWVDPSRTTLSKSRQYFALSNEEGQIRLQLFTQNQGDYPVLKKEVPFKTVQSAKDYLAFKYPKYKEVSSLHDWSILDEAGVTKGLFDRNKGHSEIWVATNRWDLEWEKRYADWLESEVDENFFIRYKIATDCADAVIGLRWIFARINSLPAANYLVHTNYLFGNFSMRKEWRKLSKSTEWHKDRLFLTALDYIMNMTSTRSLPKDSYNVSLDKKGLVPGTFMLTQNNLGGHVKVISEVNYTDITEMPIYTLSSTVPRELRVLVKEVFMDQDWPAFNDKEIMAFRWPEVKNGQWKLKESPDHENYSLEQFNADLKKEWPVFIQYVMSKVKDIYEPTALVDLIIDDLKKYLEQRILIVERGFKFCSINDCVNNLKNYDDWSTPSRDAKLESKFKDAENLIAEYSKSAPTLYKRWENRLKNEFVQIEGHNLSLHGIKFIFENKLHNSNPTKNKLSRWGLDISVYIEKKLEKVKSLLLERNAIISNPDQCTGMDCFPKSNLWVGRGTYHIDSELVKEYVDFQTYCYYLSEDLCQNGLNIFGNEKLEFLGVSKKLSGWFFDVVKFNSDPRASVERKWGLDQSLNIINLKHFETLKISSNKLALLDEHRIIDLKSNKEIALVKESVLYLTNAGDVYKYDDLKEEIHYYSKEAKAFERMLLVQNKEEKNTFSFLETKKNNYLKHESSKTKKIYSIEKNNLNLIAKDYERVVALDSLVGVYYLDRLEILKAETLSTFSLKELGIKNPSLVKIISTNDKKVLLDYSDRDNDIYKTIVLDLELSNHLEVSSMINNRQTLKWFDLNQEIAVFETNYNDEFPNIFLVQWKNQTLETNKIGNIFLGAKKIQDQVILASYFGSQWSSVDRQRKFYSFKDGKLTLFSNDQVNFELVTEKGIYLTNNQQSFLLLENGKKFGALPNRLTVGDFCKSAINTHKGRFDYRFSSSYGDFYCMGGVVDLSLSDETYVVPLMTTYHWSDSQKKEDRGWLEKLGTFEILRGTLIGIGKNSAIWIE